MTMQNLDRPVKPFSHPATRPGSAIASAVEIAVAEPISVRWLAAFGKLPT
jgi:hypothetical protein